MTLQEKIDAISLSDPLDSETIIPVELHVPTALLEEGMPIIKEYAEFLGWEEDVELPEDDREVLALTYIALNIRTKTKHDFNRFIDYRERKKAKEAAKALRESVGLD